MLIKDVVIQNEQAAFANDVQISWYPHDARNLPLVRGYMFTSTAIENKVPSVKMLKNIRDSFLYDDENRHVVIATYGHGKSHLALALANFFGQPADSEEVEALLDNIAHVTDPGEAQNLREFKEDRLPFLVVRLRGDQPQNLHQQFVQGLEAAIAEHPGAKGTALPFWFDKADQYLAGLTGEGLAKANAYLADHNIDVASLLDRIRSQRDQSVYELCVAAIEKGTGISPNLGHEVSVDAMIQWASDTFCNDEKPIAGGILILCDEFSAFIHRYAQRTVKADTPLQDMLNGVFNRQRKVVFVAFSQRDPMADAKDIYQHGGDKYDSLLKEIERLPSTKWHYLHSSLETVLDAYLKQTDAVHDIAEAASNSFVAANNATIQLLKPRYDDNMGWGYERLDQTIARGCFPLHPLTTGLFCSVEFKQVTNTRSVLGFVLHELKQRLDQPALIGGKPNWVYPTALVDWFKEMLADREYKEYEAAAAFAGPEIPDVQKAVLKAILLYGIGRLQLGKIGLSFGKAVSQLCGYSPEECESALEALRAGGYVRFDENRKVYTFWPANAGATKIEEMVRKELQGRTLEPSHITAINGKESPWVASIEVAGVDWGHPQEWAAREVLLTRPFFSAAYVRRLAPLYQLDATKGLIDGVRGCVIRLIATDDDEVEYFRDKAEEILKQALGNTPAPLPVILALPMDSTPHLCNNLLAYYHLKEWPNDKRAEVSQEAYNDKKKRVEKDIEEDLARLRGLAELVVPEAYHDQVLAQDAHKKVENALRVCYQRAYPCSPQHYFTQYQATATTHRNAVALVCPYLAYNTLSINHQVIAQNKVAEELVKKFLRQNGSTGWGLLTVTDYLTEPTNPRIKRGWDYLNKVFPHGADAVPVKDALLTLLNSPFGYDPHQVALLFFAWYGFHKRDLTMATKSGKVTVEDYLSYLKPARDFIVRICHVDPPLLSRTDPELIEREIRQMVDKVKEGTFSIADAEQTQKTLRDYAKDEGIHPELKKHVEAAVSLLEADLISARKYKEECDNIVTAMNADGALPKLLTLGNRLGDLPTLGRVNEGWPTLSALRSQLDAKIEGALEKECQKLEALKDQGDFALNKRSLELLRGNLAGRIDLVKRIEQALKNLKTAKALLEAKQRDAGIMAEVNAMRGDTPLVLLQSNVEKLKAYQPYGEETKALVEEKLAEIQAAIDEAINFITELSPCLDGIGTAQAAQTLQNEIQRRYSLFQGTPYQEQLAAASTRCTHLQQCLTELHYLQTASLQSPADVQEAESKLSSLLQSQQNYLSEHQQSLLTETKQTWGQKVAAKQQQAVQWLEQQQSEAEQGKDLEGVKRSLSKPPAFLPDDVQGTLASLRGQVEQKLDQENAARKLREQDLPIVSEVAAMQPNVGLATLRANINRLAEMAPAFPETVSLIQEKRAHLSGAMDKAIALVSQLSQRAEEVIDTTSVRLLDQDVQRAYNRYDDTPEMTTLSAISIRCKMLEEFFQKRLQVEQTPISNPQDATTLLTELSALQNAYASSLNAAQCALLATAREAIEKRLNEKRLQAAEWLIEKDTLAKTTRSPEHLLAQMESPPEFLAEDQQNRLSEIRFALQQRIAEREETRKRQEQDAPIAAAVKAMPIKGPLATMRNALQELEAYEPILPETQNLIKQKIEAINKTIKDMELEPSMLILRLKEAVSPKQVKEVESDLFRAQNLYVETPEQTSLAEIAEYCVRLGECLRERNQIEQTRPATPKALEELFERLTAIETQFAANLSPKQTALFETAHRTLKDYADSKVKEAVAWIEQHEKKAEEMTDPGGLLQALAGPPPFLPASCATSIEAMRQKAHLKIDEDEVERIIVHFKQISDKAKRAACLAALQALMQETND